MADGDIGQCDACNVPVASEAAEFGGQKDSKLFWTQGETGIATWGGPQVSMSRRQ